jgi:Zn-dependent protease with chaperone function
MDSVGPFPWPVFVGLVVAIPEVISTIATLLQRSRIGYPIPTELAGIYAEAEYEESNKYSKAKTDLGLLSNTVELIVFYSIWFLKGFPWLDGVALEIAHHIVGSSTSTWGQIVAGLAFMGIYGVFNAVISLPWDIYRTFWLEAKFGFNKTTVITFIKDRIKGMAIALLLGVPLLILVQWFFITAGKLAWLWVALSLTTFQIVMLLLMPVLILPLFYQMIPLPDKTAVITRELENETKEGALNFLFGRVFYGGDEIEGKPTWCTEDRRFQGSKAGAVLSIYWREEKRAWVIAEGPAKKATEEADTIYATCAEEPRAQRSIEWTISPDARREDAGDAMLPNSATTSCVNVGALRQKLLALADQLGYQGAKIFIIDGSSRSAHSNAFCTGFGKFRRICLFDTLLPVMEEGEIIAILGHEIGHDRLYHVHTRLVVSIAYLFVTLYVMGLLLTSEKVSTAFYVSEPKVYLGLVLFSTMWSVIEFVFNIPMTIKSRSDEYQADRYSVEANKAYAKDLAGGLKKLMKKSKANLTPHPFFVFLNYSHPPLDDRIRAIEAHYKKIHGSA